MDGVKTVIDRAVIELRLDEGAVETTQIFAWIAVVVVAVVAAGALIQALGVNVIEWVRGQIGV
jgi:hypothetical protein